ncbi:monovalent cation/H(+) antiporter subunit G [Mesobacillus subterraneus]|uniref:Na+/H+ antiporter subunit G n=1 Tax=Mesobacillus subterraneus TaxID=285983 RepID=A0A3R9ECY9_9BACI|nr:monovalent cation/H(+) antiporter subunit G [Mesobacillus subterraneus]RSD27539.1 Na+/H+ antiporter subunit G [Mesobacillus subterraneus]
MTDLEIAKFFAGIFILLGAFLSLVTAFGLIRLPDVYTRNHAASKSATLGVMFVLLGTFIYFYFVENHFNSRLLLGIAFILLTSPVAGHLIGRAAYNSGVKPTDLTVQDDLATAKKTLAAMDQQK